MNFVEQIYLGDDLDILDIINMGLPRRIYYRADHFNNMDNLTFFKRFRLLKPTLAILELIEEGLEFPNDLNNSVLPINQLLTTLRFYASSGHLAAVGDFMGLHESTASRIVARVSSALARLHPQFVKLPSAEEVIRFHTEFYSIVRFPRVLGIVDGTHIRILSPGGQAPPMTIPFLTIADSEESLNYSISKLYIAWRQWICLKKTPLANPITRGQQLYNESLIRTRNIIERVFGIWKGRFPVLAYGIRLKLDRVLFIIPPAAVLHNIARDMHVPEQPLPADINANELDYLIKAGQVPEVPHPQDPIMFQNQLIDYFTNL